ncbi:hypothetical protein BJ742DRAFT_844873 [Cladochytrium replicatum]|nr:hypothetical protein BJ742DRAFT_844873 [Cladochytrium replicatum]
MLYSLPIIASLFASAVASQPARIGGIAESLLGDNARAALIQGQTPGGSGKPDYLSIPPPSQFPAIPADQIQCAQTASYVVFIVGGCTVDLLQDMQSAAGTTIDQAKADYYFASVGSCICLSGFNATSPYVQAYDRCAPTLVAPGTDVEKAKNTVKTLNADCEAKNYLGVAADAGMNLTTPDGRVLVPSKSSSPTTSTLTSKGTAAATAGSTPSGTSAGLAAFGIERLTIAGVATILALVFFGA